jgi:hypothetical protein
MTARTSSWGMPTAFMEILAVVPHLAIWLSEFAHFPRRHNHTKNKEEKGGNNIS